MQQGPQPLAQCGCKAAPPLDGLHLSAPADGVGANTQVTKHHVNRRTGRPAQCNNAHNREKLRDFCVETSNSCSVLAEGTNISCEAKSKLW